eukprot:TRINITY_DN22437_c0_g1_i1.p1 TRINITY_DN22437_c0_g1~~TRINITY_DN22437_c0_g1_i1.p1  ORF type:complete len:951 (-),score=170.91 TRINITY_DN22437_c0_g1_i1:150-3002(-)
MAAAASGGEGGEGSEGSLNGSHDGGTAKLLVVPVDKLEALVRGQLARGRDQGSAFKMLRAAAAAKKPLAGQYVVTYELVDEVERRLEDATSANGNGGGSRSQNFESTHDGILQPPAKVQKTGDTASVRTSVPLCASATTNVTPASTISAEMTTCCGSSDSALPAGGTKMAPAPEPSQAELDMLEQLRISDEERLKQEERLREIKEQRMRDMFDEMDAQMRGWCRTLATRKCLGDPWKNIGDNKIKVLTDPKLEAACFEGEYIPPGATFGVEEMRECTSDDGRRWLRLSRGGWVSSTSRSEKRSNTVVAKPVEHHQEMAGDEVFEVGPSEDRRDAYLRMVHRRNEAELRIPEGLKVELMPYQVEGLEWLVSLFNNDLSGLLADEMGLGKTIQTVALLAFLKETKKRYGPHLVICPKSVVVNWQQEIGRCFPEYEEHVLVFQGNPTEREAHAKRIRKALKKSRRRLIVVTNYEQVHPDRNHVLHEPTWDLIVVDEGHRMKNQKSVFHQTMKEKLKGRMKLLLTGTPLQNNLDELFSLLNYLLPEIFSNASSFKSWFARPVMEKLESLAMNEYFVSFTEEEERLLISNLHAMLAPFLLQRTKADVLNLASLPPRREELVRVPLSAWQKRTYDDLKTRTLRQMDANGGEVAPRMLNNTTMQLRKIVLHPYLFGRGVGERAPEELILASGKLETLDRLLRKVHRFGHRVLVFSQFTSMLDILEDLMRLRNWGFERIDGQVSAEDRQARIRRFSEPHGGAFVFLLSSRAGAVGLNLQAADTVVLFDLDWNPQNDKQAIARAHRYGQTKEVLVVRLLTTSSIELHMEKTANEKLELERKIIGAGGFSKRGSTKTPEERAEMLQNILGMGSGGNASSSAGLRADTLREANAKIARSAEERVAFDEEDAAMGIVWQDGQEDFPDGDVSSNILVRSKRLMAPDAVPKAFEMVEDEDDDSE